MNNVFVACIVLCLVVSNGLCLVLPPRMPVITQTATYSISQFVHIDNGATRVNSTGSSQILISQNVDGGCALVEVEQDEKVCVATSVGRPVCNNGSQAISVSADLRFSQCNAKVHTFASVLPFPVCTTVPFDDQTCSAGKVALKVVGVVESLWDVYWQGVAFADEDPDCSVTQSGGPIVFDSHPTEKYSFTCDNDDGHIDGHIISLDGSYQVYYFTAETTTKEGEFQAFNSTLMGIPKTTALENVCSLVFPANCLRLNTTTEYLQEQTQSVVETGFEKALDLKHIVVNNNNNHNNNILSVFDSVTNVRKPMDGIREIINKLAALTTTNNNNQ